MQRTRWWAQAIDRGVSMAVAIWLVSVAVVAIGAFVVGGPLEFLRLVGVVGPYLLIIILAFTAPLWVSLGLMILVSLGLRETWDRRGATARDGANESSRQVAQGLSRWSGRALRRWSRRWGNVEHSVLGWFVIRPALAGRGTEGPTVDVSALPDGGYLRAYARRWMVQALVLFATLAFIAVIGTASTLTGDEMELAKHVVNPAVPAFMIALEMCGVACARYVVTRMMMRRQVGEPAS